jgi:F-type H+-transporting ATPase subunit delta
MISLRIAQRYARVIFDCARETGVLEAARADLDELNRLVRGSRALQAYLQGGNLSAARQRRTLAALFEGRVDPLIYRFLCFLERKRRLPVVAAICTEFRALCDRFDGIVRARLTTAYALDPPQIGAIAALVPLQARERVEMTAVQNAALRGGFHLQVGDVLYDYSVAGHLQRIRRELLAGRA